MRRPRISVIGAGAMGALHARSIAASGRADLAQVIDVDASRALEVTARHGGVAATPVTPIDADAVVIAAPTDRHVELATALLGRGIPVLVEKPLAPDAGGLDEILSASQAENSVLMCGFVERFNPVIVALDELLDEPLLHFVAIRHSQPAPRAASSVASDLLIHDLDLAVRIHGMSRSELRLDDEAHVMAQVSGGLSTGPDISAECEVADCTLSFSDGALATMSASRISQRKIREIKIMTASAQYELDLLRHDITIYRHVHHGEGRHDASYRSETVIEIPFVRAHQEPLASQLDHFCDLIEGTSDPAIERAGIWMPHQLVYELCRSESVAVDLAMAQ